MTEVTKFVCSRCQRLVIHHTSRFTGHCLATGFKAPLPAKRPFLLDAPINPNGNEMARRNGVQLVKRQPKPRRGRRRRFYSESETAVLPNAYENGVDMQTGLGFIPVRALNTESDHKVPLLNALTYSGGVVILIGTLAFVVEGTTYADLLTWRGWLASAVATAVSVGLVAYNGIGRLSREMAYKLEPLLNIDLNDDGFIGETPRQIRSVAFNSYKSADTEELIWDNDVFVGTKADGIEYVNTTWSDAECKKLAAHIANGGVFSVRSLRDGGFSERLARQFSREARDNGLIASDHPNATPELTTMGRAFFDHFHKGLAAHV